MHTAGLRPAGRRDSVTRPPRMRLGVPGDRLSNSVDVTAVAAK